MEIKNENLIAGYNAADENTKQVLRAMFPDMEWNSVTERIKTFEDACAALGNHALVNQYRRITEEQNPPMDETAADLIAYLKLRIITAALNEEWEPQFTEEERRYYPWFYLWTEEELNEKDEEWKREHCLTTMQYHRGEWVSLTYAESDITRSTIPVSARLCFKSGTLAEYAGKTFIDLWMDFYLIRK